MRHVRAARSDAQVPDPCMLSRILAREKLTPGIGRIFAIEMRWIPPRPAPSSPARYLVGSVTGSYIHMYLRISLSLRARLHQNLSRQSRPGCRLSSLLAARAGDRSRSAIQVSRTLQSNAAVVRLTAKQIGRSERKNINQLFEVLPFYGSAFAVLGDPRLDKCVRPVLDYASNDCSFIEYHLFISSDANKGANRYRLPLKGDGIVFPGKLSNGS